MSDRNVDLVKRLAEAFLGNDFETSLSLMDPDIQVYPRPEEPGVDDVYRGHDGMFEWATNWYSQWDDYDVEPVSYRDAPGDQVLVVFRERGRMDRAGIEVEEEFSHSFTVRDGKVVEWRQYDSYEQALDSLGLVE